MDKGHAMATQRNLPDELDQQIQQLAHQQNREPDEVFAEAVQQYIDRQSWVSFVKENERMARAKGITEDDVDRLIAEVRQENRSR
jgi:predicted transcriptional regulator